MTERSKDLAKKLYALDLFEWMEIGNEGVERVPGGWIFSMLGDGRIFVPFNNEFQVPMNCVGQEIKPQ